MELIKFDIMEDKKYYRFNKDHTVCVHEDNEDLIYVYIMDNNNNTLNYIWCKNTSITKIEIIASEMLYDLGYDGKIVEYNPYEGQAYYYLPDSNDLEFPVDIHYFKDSPNGRLICGEETIYSANEYFNAMKRHQENKDTLESIGAINFDEIDDTVYRINEYSDGAILGLYDLSEVIGEFIQRLDQGFRKNFIDQLNEAYEINTYLLDKVGELERKLPSGLHLEYPD